MPLIKLATLQVDRLLLRW